MPHRRRHLRLSPSRSRPLFDGKTFAGWEGGTEKTWRIEDGAIIDYTETDSEIPLEGKIGLQIHGNCKAVISYRNIKIETLPNDIPPDQGQIYKRFADPREMVVKPELWNNGTFNVADEEVIVFAGQANLAQETRSGWLESRLATAHAAKNPSSAS